MNAILSPTLELTVLLPGMLLAYLPVIPCLKQSPRRLAAWLAPLLLAPLCFGWHALLCTGMSDTPGAFCPVTACHDAVS